MTVKEIFDAAVMLLGYDEATLNAVSPQISKRMLICVESAINDTAKALRYTVLPVISSAFDDIDIPEYVLRYCTVYGVAAMLAVSENDSDNQRIFAQMFNERLACISKSCKRSIIVDDCFKGECE